MHIQLRACLYGYDFTGTYSGRRGSPRSRLPSSEHFTFGYLLFVTKSQRSKQRSSRLRTKLRRYSKRLSRYASVVNFSDAVWSGILDSKRQIVIH